mmetsp:Transcript_27408/g.40468  ORF Transcript_27408/g.40468 Transcript_27408/m.40468 type:complete len:525 (-) Transcript_27408:121-1695(-)
MATNNKYDRQLRLWGAKGQKAVGETTVILIRASAAGTETLKNLVLPGVGRIIVLDDVKSSQDGSDSNFFLSSTHNSKSRAQVAFELLQELNPDVSGNFEHVNSLMAFDYEKLLSNTPNPLIVAADLEYPLMMRVSKIAGAKKIPLIVVHAYGLMGLVRIQSPPIPVIDPKPDNATPDLRLVTPFKMLEEYCNAVDLEALDDKEHGHVPYPVILYQLAKKWKHSHDGKLPSTFQEKQEFRATVKNAARNVDMEVNFIEAVDNSYLAYTERTVDVDYVKNLLEKSSGKFATLLHALLKFLVTHNGAAPLHGALPDMTASTQAYVQLQTYYREKAQHDVKELLSYCSNSPEVAEEDVQTFAQNVATLDLIQVRSLAQEFEHSPPADILEGLQSATWDPYEIADHTPLLWYCGLRACHHFYREKGRYPGTCGDNWQQDVALLQACIIQIVKDLQLDQSELIQQTLLGSDNKFAEELTRYANAEIHTIASIIGGVASQEAVKLITGQYIPINNTYIFNGIASVGGVYEV